jgi:hypothetical protein
MSTTQLQMLFNKHDNNHCAMLYKHWYMHGFGFKKQIFKNAQKKVLAKGFGKSKNSQLTTKVNVYLSVPKFKLSSLTYESTLFVN